jgi:hypothetical protein
MRSETEEKSHAKSPTFDCIKGVIRRIGSVETQSRGICFIKAALTAWLYLRGSDCLALSAWLCPCGCAAASCASGRRRDIWHILISSPPGRQSYVRLRAPGFPNATSTSNALSLLYRAAVSTSSTSSTSTSPFSPSSFKNTLARYPLKLSHSCHSVDRDSKPVMYHRNSHQTDICLELLLTARVPFR